MGGAGSGGGICGMGDGWRGVTQLEQIHDGPTKSNTYPDVVMVSLFLQRELLLGVRSPQNARCRIYGDEHLEDLPRVSHRKPLQAPGGFRVWGWTQDKTRSRLFAQICTAWMSTDRDWWGGRIARFWIDRPPEFFR
eukprot:1188953-Prorocentrum_minimum.AAC.1